MGTRNEQEDGGGNRFVGFGLLRGFRVGSGVAAAGGVRWKAGTAPLVLWRSDF